MQEAASRSTRLGERPPPHTIELHRDFILEEIARKRERERERARERERERDRASARAREREREGASAREREREGTSERARERERERESFHRLSLEERRDVCGIFIQRRIGIFINNICVYI